jgi:hypothetical protein
MAYRIVKGTFHLSYQGVNRRVGSQPDGGSLWFKPDKPQYLKDLRAGNQAPRSAQINPGGMAQLRFEAIDAVVLHFQHFQQESKAPKGARHANLDGAGFDADRVEYTSPRNVTARNAKPHAVGGHILTRSIHPYGRPVALVCCGDSDKQDSGLRCVAAGQAGSGRYAAGSRRGGRAPPRRHRGGERTHPDALRPERDRDRPAVGSQ